MSEYVDVIDGEEDDMAESAIPEVPAAKVAVPKSASMFPPAPESDSGDSIWLTSYADLMTLIACFFILMTAFANFDPESFSRKAAEMAKHFSGEKPVEAEEQDPMTQLMSKLEDNSMLKENASIKMQMDGLVINFSGSALFDSGRADLKPEVREALDIMIDLVQEKSKDSRIVVEGHTDDSPLVNSSRYRNNWELSGVRASRVVERFEEFGFDSKNLVAVGYGSTRPLKPNHDDNGQALFENMKENRRVVIKIMKAPKKMKREKMGLGVYLDDNKILDSSAVEAQPIENDEVKVEVNGEIADPNPPQPVER
jgi:chemotaxis protein MotB